MSSVTIPLRALMAAGALVMQATAAAPHQHGVVNVEVTLEGASLVVELRAPMEALLGFEHAPRTAAEIDAANDLRDALLAPPPPFVPKEEAGCTSTVVKMNDRALLAQGSPGSAPVRGKGGHADVGVYYGFTCTTPNRLESLQIRLFDEYPRVHRVVVRAALGGTPFERVLRRPSTTIELKRR